VTPTVSSYAFTRRLTLRPLRDYVEGVRSKLLEIHDGIEDRHLRRARTRRSMSSSRPRRLAGLKLDREALIAALQAQTPSHRRAWCRVQTRGFSCRVTGRFRSERPPPRHFVVDGPYLPLERHRDRQARILDPPSPFRFHGMPAIGVGIAMRSGATCCHWGATFQAAMTKITRTCQVGIEPRCADQRGSWKAP